MSAFHPSRKLTAGPNPFLGSMGASPWMGTVNNFGRANSGNNRRGGGLPAGASAAGRTKPTQVSGSRNLLGAQRLHWVAPGVKAAISNGTAAPARA
jgi:hypothetical protein